ncbi:MAG: EVE domain-containing protein [Hyphomicrobiales bacterium]|nr:EVE domain-containing protein [Hyphomicrobiales bacterium]
MAYWLFKSEPGTWSWHDQIGKGTKGEEWNGVRNHTAKLNMIAMKKGDLGFFYHSVDEKQIVGVVEVIAESHPDSTDSTGKWFCVDVAAKMEVPRPVTLAEIKADKRLADMALVKQSRLSVQAVTEKEWEIICTMAEVKKAPKSAVKKPTTKTATKAAAVKKPATKTAARTATKTIAKAPAKTAAKTTAKAPAKTAAKTAAKAPAKTVAKTAAKAPVKTAAKTAAKAPAKTAAKATAKPAAAKKPATKTGAKPAVAAKKPAARTASKSKK